MQTFKKLMITICISILSGAAFTFGQWYTAEMINENKRRKEIDERKERLLSEIRERRAQMGVDNAS